jgi:HPt (histidine-containing phosphotransfer) domain-containing protein
MAEDRQKCLADGCSDYLTKPVNKELLLKVLGNFLKAAETSETNPPEAPPQPPERPNPVVVRSQFADDPDMGDVLNEFVSRLPERVTQLGDLLHGRNFEGLRRVVHQLKGAGGGYGFVAITTAAAQTECQLKTNAALEAITQDVQSLIELIRSVEGYDPTRENICGSKRIGH